MSITLELTPTEEDQLREAARARDMELADFLKACGLQAARHGAEVFPRPATVEELARGAVRDVQAELHRKGISLVYEKDGQVVEELPGGQCVPLASEAR